MQEVIEIVKIFNNKLILVGIFLAFYLIVGLLTWSYTKPLKYLGVPTVIAGIITIILRFVLPPLAEVVFKDMMIVAKVLPSVLGPLLTTGIVVLVLGITMLVAYHYLNKKMLDIKEEKSL